MPQCRCSKCGSRKTLPRFPGEYIRQSFAHHQPCGGKWIVDRFRYGRREKFQKQKPCTCLEYSFPHRKGSGWCKFNQRVNREERDSYA